MNNLNHCLLFLFLCGLVIHGCLGQTFTHKNVKSHYSNFVSPGNLQEFTSIVSYLPHGFVKDGSVDYTAYIQKALDQNRDVVFPNFPILINDKGLVLRDDSKLFFDRNSKLILSPSKNSSYGMLLLKKSKNIIIYNPTLVGERNEHKGKKGQWGMGIKVEDSQNIQIYNSKISNTWGDGIYITSLMQHEKSNNIKIKYGHIDNVRRNGISVISASNLVVDSLMISNSNGHSPSAGIDVEPNKGTDILEKLTFKDIYTYNNEGIGFQMYLSSYISKSRSNSISVSVINHKDEYSQYGFGVRNTKLEGYDLEGEISIINGCYENSRSKKVLRLENKANLLPNINFENIKSTHLNQEQLNLRIDKLIKKKTGN